MKIETNLCGGKRKKLIFWFMNWNYYYEKLRMETKKCWTSNSSQLIHEYPACTVIVIRCGVCLPFTFTMFTNSVRLTFEQAFRLNAIFRLLPIECNERTHYTQFCQTITDFRRHLCEFNGRLCVMNDVIHKFFKMMQMLKLSDNVCPNCQASTSSIKQKLIPKEYTTFIQIVLNAT